ncbi:MAG: AAA family ATPase, partial [Cyanobacteria bacterium J06621_3]
LKELRHRLQLATAGNRQMVFLTGEAGIGKTTLLEKFSTQIETQPDCSVALGQCIEKYGAGEAYRPVLEALNRFCHTTKGQKFISVLEQYAPSWLLQMPPLLTPAQLSRLQAQGTAPKNRWLRELAEALEVITREHALVLVLEDLHWSDTSTIELLDMLARRKELARLLVLASYRPTEVNSTNHPLRQTKQELQLHNLCGEISLNYLNQQEIENYLIRRFSNQFLPKQKFSEKETQTDALYSQPETIAASETAISETAIVDTVASEIYQRTEGNPLFVVNVVESLVEKNLDSAGEEYLNPPKLLLNIIPNNLKQLVDLQFDALDDTKQKILEAASVEGAEFLSVTVAASLKMDSEQVEAVIDDLVQLNHLITIDDVEILPDGTLSTRYRFIHALYQEGFYQRIAQNRRVRLHRTIGTQLETIYGELAHKIATQLALHFEQGMAYAKAIGYRQQAGENALRRNAHAAAIEHFQQGLALLPKVTQPAERDTLELGIQPLLGSALMTLKGQAAPEVGKAYERARQLCPTGNPEQFGVTLGLWRHTFIAGNLNRSIELGEQCFTLAKQTNQPALLGHARYALAGTLMYQGKLEQALTHADAGLADYRSLKKQGGTEALRHSQDPSATLMAYRAWILFFMGYWDQALAGMNELFELEVVRSHPQTTVTSLTYSGILYLYLQEFDLAQQQLEKAVQLARTWHITQFATIAQFFLTCTLSSQHRLDPSSLSNMKTTLERRRATGADLHATGYLNRLAEGYLRAHQAETSLVILAESRALTAESNERIFAADTSRLMGELLLSQNAYQHQAKAETLFRESLTTAQQQKSATFELRAATSLAQLWHKQEKTSEARALLTPICNKFTEGLHFSDLKKAQQLIKVMSSVK